MGGENSADWGRLPRESQLQPSKQGEAGFPGRACLSWLGQAKKSPPSSFFLLPSAFFCLLVPSAFFFLLPSSSSAFFFLLPSSSFCLLLPSHFFFLLPSSSFCLLRPSAFFFLLSSSSFCLLLPEKGPKKGSLSPSVTRSRPEAPSYRRRPYRVECTGSLPTSEVKRRRARSVLGWGTAREVLWVLSAFVC